MSKVSGRLTTSHFVDRGVPGRSLLNTICDTPAVLAQSSSPQIAKYHTAWHSDKNKEPTNQYVSVVDCYFEMVNEEQGASASFSLCARSL